MRIFISATSDFKPAFGGIAELTHQMAQFLSLAGHPVAVAAAAGPQVDHGWDGAQGYAIWRTAPRGSGALSALVRAFRPDLIVVNVAGSSWARMRILAWSLGCPLALFVHGNDITKRKSWLSWWKTRVSLALSDRILANSHYTAGQLGVWGGRSQRTIVFYPGLDPCYGQASGEDLPACPIDGPIRLLSLCRHTERKGLDQSLRAFSRLKDAYPDVVYWIAGTGDQTADLKALCQTLGLQDRVHFWGPVDDARKFALYRGCHLYLMPNRRLADGDVEGFGICFLEANAYGLPVIGGLEGGSAEAIADGATGWLVDGANLDAVTRALDEALGHPERWVSMGSLGRTRARTEFTYPVLVGRLVHQLAGVGRTQF